MWIYKIIKSLFKKDEPRESDKKDEVVTDYRGIYNLGRAIGMFPSMQNLLIEIWNNDRDNISQNTHQKLKKMMEEFVAWSQYKFEEENEQTG